LEDAVFRAVIVGAGNMGRTWGRNLRDHGEVEIAGWVDLRPELAADAAIEFTGGKARTGGDLERMLRDLHPDFVVDVSVPEAHHDVTLTALAAGVPVLGEKPMADTMEHARAMVAASERAGKLYMVSQSRRYHPQLTALRALIQHEIGPLGILNSDFYVGAHFGGFRDQMPSPLLLDMAIHTFDAARFLSGADPLAVYCEEFNPSWSWYAGAASATALFEMTGGLRFTYRGSWCAEGQQTSWDADWRAVGPRGEAIWNGWHDPVARVAAERTGLIAETISHPGQVDPEEPSGIAASLRDFLRALRAGSTPMGECHDNIQSLAMVFAAIQSAATGRRIAIEEVLPLAPGM
jgi:predicted dehydrogenase